MTIQVLMLAFGGGQIRPVDVPEFVWNELKDATVNAKLSAVYHYGQNDFQPKPFPSVSVGDVILLDGARYLVASHGFEAL